MAVNRVFSKNGFLNILFLLTFLIHLFWVIYVLNVEKIEFIEDARLLLFEIYSAVGFDWRGGGSYFVTSGLLSSVFVNLVRRILEGVLFGWPQFKEHDRTSFIRALLSVFWYGVIIYFAVGYFGEKYSIREVDLVNVMIVAISTYIVGLFVDLVDDFVSGFYCVIKGGLA